MIEHAAHYLFRTVGFEDGDSEEEEGLKIDHTPIPMGRSMLIKFVYSPRMKLVWDPEFWLLYRDPIHYPCVPAIMEILPFPLN